MTDKIAIACDHAGLPLKKILKDALPEIEWLDFGTDSEDSVDYPDFGEKLALAVTEGQAERGILICGTGLGIAMAANRHKGVRAAPCTDTTMARLTREHNNANVLALGQRLVGSEVALDIVRTFLETEFEGGRHQRRIDKLDQS